MLGNNLPIFTFSDSTQAMPHGFDPLPLSEHEACHYRISANKAASLLSLLHVFSSLDLYRRYLVGEIQRVSTPQVHLPRRTYGKTFSHYGRVGKQSGSQGSLHRTDAGLCRQRSSCKDICQHGASKVTPVSASGDQSSRRSSPGYELQFALHTLIFSLILKLFPQYFLDFGT